MRYRHNVDNAANNPYVIVGVFEGRCSREQYPPIPKTPILAMAYEEGMLDASFGQIVSFASFYQTSFRVEVPLWHKLKDGTADPALDSQTAPRRGTVEMPPKAWMQGQTVQRRMQMRELQKKRATSQPRGKDASPLR